MLRVNNLIGFGLAGGSGSLLVDIDLYSYASKSLSVSSQEDKPLALEFSADGTKAYVIGQTNNRIYQYTLSTPWDVSTGSYASKSFSVASQDSKGWGFSINDEGTKAYVTGEINNRIYQYTLSTPWDISTASYASKNFLFSSQTTTGRNTFFKPDGLTMFLGTQTAGMIYQYTLSTAWDISTASYASKSLDVSANETAPTGIELSPDGRKLFALGFVTADTIFQYTLSTPYDLSTGSYDSKSLSVNAQESIPFAVRMSADGSRFYVVGQGSDAIFQYEIT